MTDRQFLFRIFALILLAVLLLLPVWNFGKPAEPDQSTTAATVPTTQPTVTTVGSLEVQLLGEPIVILEYGTDYEDPGILVTYNGHQVDARVTVDLPEFGMPGDYTVTYDAEYQGVGVKLCRTVRTVDTQPPVITLTAAPDYATEIGEEYREEGFQATDNCDGDLTDRVIRQQVGDSVFYTVADSSGNVATVQRDLVYRDTRPPVLTLLGGDTVTVMAGDAFEDPGCTAMDAADGDLTGSVTVDGSYDPWTPGTYTYTYTVQDAQGNVAAATRQVVVQGHIQPETVYPEGKVIYLTFDDGPSRHTGRLLEILEKYNVKATFFVVGGGKLEYLDDIVAGGHAIGIHSNTHDYQKIYSGEKAFFQDFNAIRDKIYDRTGSRTTLIRFPGGSSNRVSKEYCTGIMTLLTRVVEERGYQYFDWNVDSNDAGGAKTATEVFKNVISGVQEQSHSVVLQHDTQGFSVDAVERIIQWGLANGYTFLPLEPTSPKAHHNVRN